MQDKTNALENHPNRIHWAVRRFEDSGQVMCYDSVWMYGQLAQAVRGQRVCDVGCSIGMGTAVLERTAAFVLGCDILKENIAWAKQMYPWAMFKTWDILQGPVPGRYNEVVCLEMIEHVHDGSTVARNLLATAQERVWVSTPNGLSELELGVFVNNPAHMTLYTPEDMSKLFLEAGAREVITHAFNDISREVSLTDPEPRVILCEVLK
jgi:2-polyprenyl-3-methyl-5-hydroxy-6-metoxy-1,4-benzoquinol methylase